MMATTKYMLAANCSKSNWSQLIQVFEDPEITSTQKKHLVLMLHELDEDWLFNHHNDMPRQLTNCALQYGAKTVFFQSKSEYPILQHAIVNGKSDHIIINMVEMGGKALVNAKDISIHGRNAIHIACLQQVSSKVLLKLIDKGGREGVLARDNHGSSALHFILKINIENVLVIRKLVELELKMSKIGKGKNNLFNAVFNDLGITLLHLILRVDKHNYCLIKKLVDVGGKKLIMRKCSSGWNALCTAFICDAPPRVTNLLLKEGGKELLMEKNSSGSTILERIILMKPNNDDSILELIRVGGKTLINARNDFGLAILELVLRTRANSCEAFMHKIIDVVGREIITKTDTRSGWNALHFACFYDVPIEVINLFLDIGGDEMVMQEDSYGSTPLLFLSAFDNIAVVQKLASIGGKKLLMMQNHAGLNILHKICAVKKGDFTDVIKLLLDYGGKDLALSKTTCPGFFAGWTPLHYCCLNQAPLQTISILIDVGNAEILTTTNSIEKTPLHQIIDLTYSPQQTHTCNIIKLLIEKGIQYNVGGEDGIGGLFMDRTGKREYFNRTSLFSSIIDDGKWKDLMLPILVEVDKNNSFRMNLPILHVVISSGRANANIISDIIENFSGCVRRKNSMGYVPLDLAIRRELPWEQGTKKIFHVFAAAMKHRPKLNIACEFGLQWKNGMSEVFETDMKSLGVCDEETGLYPFMLAAAGHSNDVNVIFVTMRKTQNTF